MRISDLILMGLRNLSRRKARTALTVVGMVIGTISIVVMVSIGIGMNKIFTKSVMENGSMTIISIYKNSYVESEDGNYQSIEQKMDDALVNEISQIDHVDAVTPIYDKYVQLTSGKYQSNMELIAMDCTAMPKFGFPALSEGEYPTPENNEIILIGADAMQDFYYFSGRTPKQKTIELGKDKVSFTFSEYAVNEKKKPVTVNLNNYALFAESEDYRYNYCSYIDLEYFKTLYKKYAATLKAEDRKKALASLESYEEIRINVDNMKNVMDVQKTIEEMGYKCESDMQYLDSMLETSNMLQMVLGAIGLVAMLVSAINIANTMVMSIYERTKEIGIMKVLGCYIRDIKKLFLFESGMIGLIGGTLGMGFSYLASHYINKYGGTLLSSIMPGGGYYTEEGAKFSQIPIWLPLAAMLFAIVVGVVAGYIPARRATKISAIEAMKTDG